LGALDLQHLRLHDEWDEYAARSSRLIPWKLLGAPFRAPMQKVAQS
jgi:hypothetical protein